MQRSILAANHALINGTAGSGDRWAVVSTGQYRYVAYRGHIIFEYFGNQTFRFCLRGHNTLTTRRWINQLMALNNVDARVSSREGQPRLTYRGQITSINSEQEYTVYGKPENA